jgi:hypothetical protein
VDDEVVKKSDMKQSSIICRANMSIELVPLDRHLFDHGLMKYQVSLPLEVVFGSVPLLRLQKRDEYVREREHKRIALVTKLLSLEGGVRKEFMAFQCAVALHFADAIEQLRDIPAKEFVSLYMKTHNVKRVDFSKFYLLLSYARFRDLRVGFILKFGFVI